MRDVQALYDKLTDSGVKLYLWDLGDASATTIAIDGAYGIFMDFDNIETAADELCVVAHEAGHFFSGATHRVDSPLDVVGRHECKANKWAIAHCIPVDDLDDAVADGCTEWWQLAERLGVTESFVKKAVCLYTYGNLADELYF
ncbi:MAG: ImmA/IrrE family metallo-endopeptidase [Clostridium sp. SCN 57-10]|nr:MAG: ImmA/IrrE family metallo-endopeptidase [Clostridium sp. SCN 57-10]